MAYTYAIIEAQVRANVNDTTAPVTQEIDDAINLLSNFFSLKKISTSIATVASQAYIDKPTNTIVVERLKIGTDEYKETSLAKLGDVENDETKNWYDYNDKLQISPTPTAITTTKIWYRSGFTALAGAGSTDVPDRLVPLLVILATWLYYVQMVSKVGTARENFPDMTPKEASELATEWKKQFDSLLASIKATKQV